MMCVLRGVRVIDPASRTDRFPQDVWLQDGRIEAIDSRIDRDGVPVIDLTQEPGSEPCVVCPGFIDLHAHLREPGDEDAETVASGAAAAAAGGFTAVVAMSNTRPPIDTPERVARAAERNAVAAPIRILQVAALSRELAGAELTDVQGCVIAGAVAIGDDGRNAASPALLEQALQLAARVLRPVFVHPEDENAIARMNAHGVQLTRAVVRPAEVEVRAVDEAIGALHRAAAGRLHLQHVSAAGAVDLVRRARERGLAVTAEVSPHHLSMQTSTMDAENPMRKVNPPLRSDVDVAAVQEALRDGVIGAVATDHAPHRMSDKLANYTNAPPGMIGLETALAQCLSGGGLSDALPLLVARLTVGPRNILGAATDLPTPRLRAGEPATLTVFDPGAVWTVSEGALRSRSRNTPLLGTSVRGRVLLTVATGEVVHRDPARIPAELEVTHV